ncbi:hypothetical protein [Sulfuriroseicoccus oceanibius]|uniref:Uncharacterized protein n=1 Tax=Sulfuriroseicoccus oceanibius TaxID=2707525 RepID=A0A6B3LBS4_9BACT|nr:hypothetical protein [Sulfuriroseicoccus oceanibius]QQL45051.1 hypothetical protein G3M56_000235 [Sulfuriroseicoccus oceanibius]
MSRFKSVLIGSDEAMRNVALYIDLNPVASRWCGWTEAGVGWGKMTAGVK